MKLFLKMFTIAILAFLFTGLMYFGLQKLVAPTKVRPVEASSTSTILSTEPIKASTQTTPQRPEWPDVKLNIHKPMRDQEYHIITEHWPIMRNSTQLKNPLVRIPPKMPEEATKSGQCSFKALVNENGSVTKLSNLECTDGVFLHATKKAVLKWKFMPKIVEGKPIPFESNILNLNYNLLDKNGNVIPK